MTFFIKLREQIRHFFVKRESILLHLWSFAVSFVSLLTINQTFGYQKALNHWWVSVLVALLCAFFPMQGVAGVLLLFIVLHLMALSPSLAVITLLIIVVCYGVCAYFHAGSTYHFVMIPVFDQLKFPYVIPLTSALLRDTSEIASVVCGTFLSFFFKTVRDNASVFLDPTSDMTALDLMQSQMLSNSLFYFYLVAMITMFLVVYFVRSRDMEYAWFVAVLAGCLSEFVIMLTGYLYTGSYESIPMLIVGNVITFAVGCAVNYLYLGLDYSRTERVQFEDDEYYYYVTAVPKMHIAEEEKRVKTFTQPVETEGSQRRGFGWNRRRTADKEKE